MMRSCPAKVHRGTRGAGALALLLFAACRIDAAPDPAVRSERTLPLGWRYPAGALQPAIGASAMVTSSNHYATDAGVEILRQGGNAVDAAVAVGFVLAVTYPEAGNLGGGGYMVIRLGDGRTAAIDYREVAPLAATRDMFLDEQGQRTDRSEVGYLASGVPGAVAGMVAALERYGSMSLAQVMQPAIRLAEQGFVVDTSVHRTLRGARSLITRFAGAQVFFPNGEPVAPGTVLRQPALARTLRTIEQHGARGFYTRWPADSLAADMQRNGGIITRADLERYRPEWRQPLRASYRGYELISMPPSSSGGVTVAQTLNILEPFGDLPRFGTPEYVHVLASAYQRAFIDRNERLGDPAFVQVPVAELLSKEYGRTLAASVDRERWTPTPTVARTMRDGDETTHYSVVDSQGNAVATTTTINSLYGSGVYIAALGIFMNNEMDDFAARPGASNQYGLVEGEANAIAPGKRMLSAMSPTIVLDRDGGVLLVVGSRGGPRIITSTSQVILNVLAYRMSLADAFAAPRIHHQALPDVLRYEENGLSPETAAALESMGHRLEMLRFGTLHVGTPNGIMRVPGGWQGVADPRGPGTAKGF